MNCLIYLPMYIALEIRLYALIYCSHNVKETWNKSTASNNLDLIDQIDFFFRLKKTSNILTFPVKRNTGYSNLAKKKERIIKYSKRKTPIQSKCCKVLMQSKYYSAWRFLKRTLNFIDPECKRKCYKWGIH